VHLVGLTGGIGSGKSTVARRFAERGAVVVDADRVAREVVEPGEPALARIVERFGEGVLDDHGRLDRAALATIVFDDEQARRDLEAITHPRIGERIAARIAEVRAAEEADGRTRVVVLDHPLLVETGLAAGHDVVVVVEAPVEERIRRLVEQRGMDAADARARIAAQADDAARRAAATHVLDNGGRPEDLDAQVDALLAELGVPAP
jgi:dephospho-CoA kinase